MPVRRIAITALLWLAFLSSAWAQALPGVLYWQDWYFSVTDSSPGTQVWSTKRGQFVTLADATYVTWQTTYVAPTTIATIAGLRTTISSVAALNYISPSSVNTVSSASPVTLTNPPQTTSITGACTSGSVILPLMNTPISLPLNYTMRVINGCTNLSDSFSIFAQDGSTLVAAGVAHALNGKGNYVDLTLTDNSTQNGTFSVVYNNTVAMTASRWVWTGSGGEIGIAGTSNGGIPYYSNGGTPDVLTGNSTATRKFVLEASSVLQFDTIAAGDVQALAPTWSAQHIWTVASTIASATGAALDDVKVSAATTTITGNTGSPITRLAKVGLYRPTITDSSAVTVTDAATLYIDNSPLAAGSVTLTNTWALLVGAGSTKLQATTMASAVVPLLGPASDSTTAFKITKADLSTAILTVDTTNKRIGINKTPGAFDLDVNGAVNLASTLATADQITTTKSANADVINTVSNANGSGAATARQRASNGTNNLDLGMSGTAFTPYGAIAAATAFLYSGVNIVIMGDTTATVAIAAVGNTTTALFNQSGTASTSKTTGAVVVTGGLGVSGKVTTDTLNVITMANTATTSAVCYNTGTGLVTYDGTIGTCTVSSKRFKQDWVPLSSDDALQIALQLKPGSYKKRPEWGGIDDPARQFGFLAEDIAEVDERLIGRDKEGKPYQVRYQQSVAVAFGAIKRLKADNDNLRDRIEQLERKVAR